MLRSERLAAAAAIFRMSGLLFDFMMSAREGLWQSQRSVNATATEGAAEGLRVRMGEFGISRFGPFEGKGQNREVRS